MKNLKINHEFFQRKIIAPLLIVTTLTTTGVLIKKGIDERQQEAITDSTLGQVVINNSYDKQFDDYYEKNQSIYTDIALLEISQVIIDTINKTLNKEDIDTKQGIDGEELNNYDPLTTLGMYLVLYKQYTETVEVDEKNNLLKEMSKIHNTTQTWLNNNAYNILNQILNITIKSEVANNLNLEPSEYDKIEIKVSDYSEEVINVTYKNEQTYYEILITEKSGPFYEVAKSLLGLKETDKNNEQILNNIKLCLATKTYINKFDVLIDDGIIKENNPILTKSKVKQ